MNNIYNPYQQNGYGVRIPIEQQPTFQQSQSITTNSGLMTIFVSSEEEVNNYPVAAGLTVLLVSFNLKKFWLKSTNTSGIPNQLRTFTFDETTPAQGQTGAEFVTKTEFSALNEKIDKLLADLGGK